MKNYYDPVTINETRDRFLKYRRNFIICPEQWETLAGAHLTLNWQRIKFTEANRNILPQVEGIYIFAASPEKINASFINYFFYVGETDDLQRRFGEYLGKIHKPKSPQYKVYTIIDDFPDHLYFNYVQLPGYNEKQRKIIEDQFLIGFTPPINSKYPQGLERIIRATYEQ